MKLVLLGTGGYHPSELRHTACLMLPSEGIVLDAGTAMFRVRDWLETDTLDILITHAHLDHVIGLTFLFDVLYQRDVKRVTAHIANSKIRPIYDHLFADDLFPVQPPCEILPIEELSALGTCQISWFPLEHPGGSVGFRLDWPDRSMAYVTDTVAATDAAYLPKIKEVDLLVHECYFADGEDDYAQLTGHSWATSVAQVAKQANVGQLVLVHVNPVLNDNDPIGLETVQSIFPNTQLGTDGMQIEF